MHRARNLYAKLPERERERVKHAYWQALDDAISAGDAKQKLQALVDKLAKGGYTAAAKCLADDLDALVVHLRYPPRHRRAVAEHKPARPPTPQANDLPGRRPSHARGGDTSLG